MRSALFLTTFWCLVPPAAVAAGTPEILPPGFALETVVAEPLTGNLVGFSFLPDGRFVVVERPTGVVRVAVPGDVMSDSVFTIPGVRADHAERGLLGVAVDPEWPARPYLYFHYTHVDSVVHIEMYTCSGDLTDSTSTNVVLSSPFVLLDDIDDDNFIHNAGTLRFGPDGMLFVSVGDDAQFCPAQDLTSPLGKILRLDVSSMPGAGPGPPPKSELDPGDNPFPGPDETERLVLARGLRNPFRFTIDPPTGDVFIGSVGQNWYEEVNLVPGPTYEGLDFGWPLFDGPDPYFCCPECDPGVPFTDAIHVIPHPKGPISITGGPVMRPAPGSAAGFPAAYDGDYFYFEFFSGDLVRLRETGGTWDVAPPVPGQADPARWGQGLYGASDARVGPDGALYFASHGLCCGLARGLYRIVCDGCAPDVATPDVTEGPVVGDVRTVPNPLGRGQAARFELDVEPEGAAVVKILDVAGRVVRRLETTPSRSVVWDGRDADGRPLPAGTYVVRVVSERGEVRSGKLTVR